MSETISNCQNCGRPFPQSKVHSHYAYCRRNIRKCRQCGEFIDINEEEEHIQQAHFRQPCQYCSKYFGKNELEHHQRGCLSQPVNCQFCEMPMKKGEIDEHVSTCGTRTKVCDVCDKNIMLLDFASHIKHCAQQMTKPSIPTNTKNSKPFNINQNLSNCPPPVDPKYRVQRLGGPVTSNKPSPSMRKQPSFEDQQMDFGLSPQQLQAQHAMFQSYQRNRGRQQWN